MQVYRDAGAEDAPRPTRTRPARHTPTRQQHAVFDNRPVPDRDVGENDGGADFNTDVDDRPGLENRPLTDRHSRGDAGTRVDERGQAISAVPRRLGARSRASQRPIATAM